eukprot:scaffold19293_cov90-Isochrysis_galbana.AAC.1
MGGVLRTPRARLGIPWASAATPIPWDRTTHNTGGGVRGMRPTVRGAGPGFPRHEPGAAARALSHGMRARARTAALRQNKEGEMAAMGTWRGKVRAAARR